jgi:hypothetical protein
VARRHVDLAQRAAEDVREAAAASMNARRFARFVSASSIDPRSSSPSGLSTGRARIRASRSRATSVTARQTTSSRSACATGRFTSAVGASAASEKPPAPPTARAWSTR